MSMRVAHIYAAMFVLALAAGAAMADDLTGFNAAVEDAASHNRAALAYLREERTGLAILELDRMRESWGLLVERYGKDRPAALRDNPDYVTTMVDVPTRIVAALMMIDFGRLDIAHNSLVAICRSLNELRQTSGETPAECGQPVE